MARKLPVGMVECPNCVDGWVEDHENGRVMLVACYHCGNTGYITDEEAFKDLVQNIATDLAISAVMELRDSCNSNPDGEGWAFAAAENMLHEYEYTQGKVWEYSGRMLKYFQEMHKQDRLLLNILIARLSKTPEPAPAPVTPAVQLQPIPTPPQSSSDELPF